MAKESEESHIKIPNSFTLQSKDTTPHCIVQLYRCGRGLRLNSSFCSQSCSAYGESEATDKILLCPRRFYILEEVLFLCNSCHMLLFCTFTNLKLLHKKKVLSCVDMILCNTATD